jgi:low temperature requirement protein LtrA
MPGAPSADLLRLLATGNLDAGSSPPIPGGMLGALSHKANHEHRRRPWAAPLGPRSPEEAHRASTPLELFFDLVIVVAVAQAASGLRPGHEVLTSLRTAFLWGYGHYFVFAAAAAVGAGLAVAVDHATHHAEISAVAAGAAVAVPVAVYLVCLWFLHARLEPSVATRLVAPLVVVGVLLTPFTGQAVLWTGLLMAGLTAFKVVLGARRGRAPKES